MNNFDETTLVDTAEFTEESIAKFTEEEEDTSVGMTTLPEVDSLPEVHDTLPMPMEPEPFDGEK